jgi:uncharacterized protein (UPF0332 family)
MLENYFKKSCQSLESANELYRKGYYDDCASRAYYACFQIALVSLCYHEIIAEKEAKGKTHGTVTGYFVNHLINERSIYPVHIKRYLYELREHRSTADYEPDKRISCDEATTLLKKANEFHSLVRESLKIGVIE